MLALMQAIPYIAFAVAGLLVAFVAGEFALKHFRARKAAKPAAPETADSGRGLAGKPEPLSTRKVAVEGSPKAVARVDGGGEASGRVARAVIVQPQDSGRVYEDRAIETVVAGDSGSNHPVEVFDESESVRMAEVAMLQVSSGAYGAVPELSPVSSREVAVNLAAEVVVEATDEAEVVQEVDDTPNYVTGADTERCPAVPAPVLASLAKAEADEAFDQEVALRGVVCNEVIARRDPSVRVFDAVVAPSERQQSAA